MKMTHGYYRQDNTEGYTDAQLDELNLHLYRAVKTRGLSFNPDSPHADQVKTLAERIQRTFDTQLDEQ
jgi:hypothetical protein